MHDCLFTITLMILSAAPPAEPARGVDERQPVLASPLGQTIDGIWKDGSIASDAEFQKLINQATTDSPAPLDMRRMVVAWPQPRTLRGWPQQMSVSFERERVSVSWSAEIGCGDKAEDAHRRFAAVLEELGYRPSESVDLETFPKEDEPKLLARQAVYMRNSGETELLVSFEADRYVGSATYNSGVRFTWYARRAFRAPHPTLAEALAALPAGMKVKYLDPKFFALLADEPLAWLVSGRDFSIKFARPATDKLVAALAQSGFEPYVNAAPHRDGSRQKTWYRYSDVAFAHVITSADGQGLRLFCQTPRHTEGPPRLKPPAMSPASSGPPRKRPPPPFEGLSFTHGELQRQAHFFHDMAEKIAGQDWHVQDYKDGRYSDALSFTAAWQSSPVKSASFISVVRPYHGVTITLHGRQVDGADRLNALDVEGISIPQEGWAARVGYSAHLSRDGVPLSGLGATVGFAGKFDPFSFNPALDTKSISLTERYVEASVQETIHLRYDYHVRSPGPGLERSLRMVCGTPETLRDEVLADIGALRKLAREQVEMGISITLQDSTRATSAEPPRRESDPRRVLLPKTRQALLDEIEKRLAAQEAILRENFREIHAAVQQALPLETLRDELLPKPSAAPSK